MDQNNTVDGTDEMTSRQELGRGERRLQTLADAMPQIVWEANALGELTYTNNRWTDYSGSSDPARWFEYVHPDDRSRVAAAWMASVVSGQLYEAEFRLLRQIDSTYRWHLVRAVPVAEEDAKARTWYGTCTDITAQKALEEQNSDAIATLHEVQERLNRALETSHVGFWSIDLPSGAMTLSQQMAEDWGIDLGLFPGTLEAVIAHIFPDDQHLAHEAMERAAAGGGSCRTVYRVIRPGDEIVWIETRGDVTKNARDEVVRFAGTSLEISDRMEAQRRLEASAAEFRALAELSPQMLFTTDPNGEVTYFNEPFLAYTGKTFDELRTNGEDVVLDPDDAERTKALFRHSLRTGEPYENQYRLRRHDGTLLWHLVRARPVRNERGAIAKWIGTITDIDEQKRIAREFEQAKEDAEAASEAKSAFLANMSHEIRTPLGAIIGFAGLLMQPGQSEPDRSDCVATIVRNGDHLLALINDILDLSKVESGKVELEAQQISLASLMFELQLILQQKAAEKGLELKFEVRGPVPSTIVADPTRLKQVLLNVLGNAIKFTQTGRVTVTAQTKFDLLHQSESLLEILVTDTGCGVAPNQIERLFEPFMQADSTTTRRYGGTGLGLALSRKLSQAMQGNLELVATALNRGSTFAVTLPVGNLNGVDLISTLRVPAMKPVPVVASSAGLGRLNGMQILLVEDTLDNQRLIARILRLAGAVVAVAENGAEGVSRGLSVPFDAVLMDIQMPVLDGYEATAKLRAGGFLAPIFALTAHAMKEESARCLAAGCTDMLTKPVDQTLLLDALAPYAALASSTTASKEVEPDDEIDDIIAFFLAETFPKILQHTSVAIETADLATVAREAHNIMGSVAVYRYRALSVLARDLEREAKGAGRKPVMRACLGALRRVCKRPETTT